MVSVWHVVGPECGRPPVRTRGCVAPRSVTRFGSLPRSAQASQPGEQAALLPAVFVRQDCLIPQRETGPPRIDQASTPITPAEYGGGAAGPSGVVDEVGRVPIKGTSGALERPPLYWFWSAEP